MKGKNSEEGLDPKTFKLIIFVLFALNKHLLDQESQQISLCKNSISMLMSKISLNKYEHD